MDQQTFDLIKRLFIALAGKGLPRISVLSVMARHFKRGCFYLMVSAVLASTFLLVNIYALYEYLLWRGLNNLESFLIVDGVVLLCAIVAKLLVHRNFCRAKGSTKGELQHTYKEGSAIVGGIIGAFMAGMDANTCDNCHKELCECKKTDELG